MDPQPQVNKVVLAYSGGLDTSVIVPWLKENSDRQEWSFRENPLPLIATPARSQKIPPCMIPIGL